MANSYSPRFNGAAGVSTPTLKSSSKLSIPANILDDLSCRFLLNVPDSERQDPVRMCFQCELAHWFYLDFYCKSSFPECKQCGLREFIRIMFNHCPFLQHWAHEVDAIVDKWRQYKSGVPTFGAILLDASMQHLLLVQGYYAKHSWGFPKGKVNEDEAPEQCAVREVLEEVGYDITSLLRPKDYLERVINETTIRLYIVRGVPTDFQFVPRTRNEIKGIRWFSLDELPRNRFDATPSGLLANHFFMVIPFVERLEVWIQLRKARAAAKQSNYKLAASSSLRRLLQQPQKQQFQHQKQQQQRVFSQDSTKSAPGGRQPAWFTAMAAAASQQQQQQKTPQGKQQLLHNSQLQQLLHHSAVAASTTTRSSTVRAQQAPLLHQHASAFRSFGRGGNVPQQQQQAVLENVPAGRGAAGVRQRRQPRQQQREAGGNNPAAATLPGAIKFNRQLYKSSSPGAGAASAGRGRGKKSNNRKLDYQHIHDVAGAERRQNNAVQRPFILGLIHPSRVWNAFRFDYSKF